MDIDLVRHRVAALDADVGWYQNIDLKCGITTKTRRIWGEDLDHPRRRWECIEPAFSTSFAGQSVLDVGCNAGFFSFVAAERGARYVLGIDFNKAYIEQAQFCNEVRGDKVDFRVDNVTALRTVDREFDITLCIGLLYHVAGIWDAIRTISRVTKENGNRRICDIERQRHQTSGPHDGK